MKEKTVLVNFRIPVSLKRAVDFRSDQRDCAVSKVMREALDFTMEIDLAVLQQIQILAARMNAHPAKVFETIVTNRLATFKADRDHPFGEPVLTEFLFGPHGLVGGNELHKLTYDRRWAELDRRWELALEEKENRGIPLTEPEQAFRGRHADPETWEKILRG